jgi:SAM-dependent methyltransferase
MFFEFCEAFQSLSGLRSWGIRNPWWTQRPYALALAKDVRRSGLMDPFLGYVPPSRITYKEGCDLRETLTFQRISSRHRAITLLLSDVPRGSKVYAPEYITPFAALLKKAYQNFVGSEYLPSIAERPASLHETRHEDVMKLSFHEGEFDVYVSCEVMEHIPSPQDALNEAARVLKPGGLFIASFPFAAVSEQSVIKATMLDSGDIEYHAPAEVHGNPVSGEGSLVFTVPGWDILAMATKAGFSTAEMVAVSSRRYGIVSSGPVPVMIMRGIR